MNDLPLVSIVIPVYNGSNYLREAIESALSQTYANIEVLVINDGSNDGGKTEAIAHSFGNKIRYFFKTNGGVASALNMGIKEMKGHYFSWLSHDDVYYDFKIIDQIAFINSLSPDVILYSNFDLIDELSHLTGFKAVESVVPRFFRYYLTVSHPVHGCTTLIPRICFDKCGLFDESLRTTQDYDFWFRLAEHFKFIHIPATHIQSRHHTEQGTVILNEVHVQECNELLIKFLYQLTPGEIMGGTGKPLSLSYAFMAKNFVFRKLYSVARKAMFKSVGCIFNQGVMDILRTVLELNILAIRQVNAVLFRKG
jgi:glycosyltransferase involved in cell wall biosynthesis